jgi:hypothetical protein
MSQQTIFRAVGITREAYHVLQQLQHMVHGNDVPSLCQLASEAIVFYYQHLRHQHQHQHNQEASDEHKPTH